MRSLITLLVVLTFISASTAVAQENYWKLPMKAPNSGKYSQWALSSAEGINAEARKAAGTSVEKVVAVVDTGITLHPEFSERVLPGYDFISELSASGDGDARDADPTDVGAVSGNRFCDDSSEAAAPASWHGTYVAGIISANNEDGSGISGIAPNSKILPLRASSNCSASNMDVSDAIIWAAGGDVKGVPKNVNPANVIVVAMSELEDCDPTYLEALRFAESRGVISVLSAGNNGVDSTSSNPSNCNVGISVGASDRKGDRAYYSNWGERVDVWAPGGDVRDTVSNGVLSTINLGSEVATDYGYGYYQGTSAAAPHVAGVISLMQAAGFSGTSKDLRTIFRQCSRKLADQSQAAVPVLDGECAINSASLD